jgi:hypothetical protein
VNPATLVSLTMRALDRLKVIQTIIESVVQHRLTIVLAAERLHCVSVRSADW